MKETFAARLRRGDVLRGTMLTLPEPAAAEVLAGVGFDWLFVDAEHGPFDLRDIGAVLQAVGDRVACIVRVPALDAIAIRRTLDLGAVGIIVPQVDDAGQAAQAVSYARYAPQGRRGVGLARAHDYGRDFAGYLRRANEDIALIVQAESITAARNIESIAAVAGIDAVLVGPYDLSASLGRTGQLEHPEVVAAIDAITEHCRAAGMPLGIFGMNAAAVAVPAQRGYSLLCAGIDVTLLGDAAAQLLAQLH